MGWLRSGAPGQRCRAVIASNPPIGSEGSWLIEWFAPWLDPMFPDPAAPGELRWCITVGTEIRWVDGPGETVLESSDGKPEVYKHQSRTFIPAMLDDNPYLRDTDYRAQMQNMPEPLRSILLKGDFMAGRQDHEWQVIPTEWVRLANERWLHAEKRRRKMIALSADVAIGGADDSVLASLHEDCWFAPLVRKKGIEVTGPDDVAAMMLVAQKDGADLSVDSTGGWGAGVASHLKRDNSLDCFQIIYSKGSARKTKDGKFGYANLRAQMYWELREALDPDDGDEIALPPDAKLTAELTTPRYRVRGTDLIIEDKDEIRKRIGRSTDGADAVVQAWSRRRAVVKRAGERAIPRPDSTLPAGPGGWLAAR